VSYAELVRRLCALIAILHLSTHDGARLQGAYIAKEENTEENGR